MPINPSIVLQKYYKNKLLRSKSDKVVWLCRSFITGEKFVVKMEKNPSKDQKQTLEDNLIYRQSKALGVMQGHPGFPFLVWSGYEEDTKLCVIQYLGDTLWHKFNVVCQKHFSVKTVCMIGLQLISFLEDYHFKNYIFCKITPESVQFGRGKNSHKLYFNDLSDSIKYNKIRQKQNKVLEDQNFTMPQGVDEIQPISKAQTPFYPKDDLFSVLKMLLSFLGCNYSSDINKQEYFDKIPKQFFKMIQKCQTLKKEEKVNYAWFIGLINQVMYHRNLHNDYIYDWIEKDIIIKTCSNSKYLPSLNLQTDQKLLNHLYLPFQQKIEVDFLVEKLMNTQQEQKKEIKRISLQTLSQCLQEQQKLVVSQKQTRKSDKCIIM